MSEVSLDLICLGFALLRFKKLATLSQPDKSKTKTNRDLLAHVLPRFVPATFISSFDWFSGLSVIGESDNLGFGAMTLN